MSEPTTQITVPLETAVAFAFARDSTSDTPEFSYVKNVILDIGNHGEVNYQLVIHHAKDGALYASNYGMYADGYTTFESEKDVDPTFDLVVEKTVRAIVYEKV